AGSADWADRADRAENPGVDRTLESVVLDRWRTALGFSGVIVMKQGRHGATVDTPTQRHHAAAPKVHVVDTTGAGDAFSAGFLAAWTTDQRNLVKALGSGAQAAATAITHLGAGPASDGPTTA
ncbi:MAG: PfkB family carbohydrate kinase, partial [Actinomycetota bacterium]|nr:PfkB family carbohydrate kinase [Actinomycetota bacterium]